MTSFIIMIVILIALLSVCSLLVALHSFGVNLPKRLKLTVGIVFIAFVFYGIIGSVGMGYVPVSTIILYCITLILGVYIMTNKKLPKRLKILLGIIAVLLFILFIISCFTIPGLFSGMTINSFVDAYSTM